MFINPFATSQTKLLKKLDKQFIALNTKFEQSQVRQIEITDELAVIDAFQSSPFKSLLTVCDELKIENISFIPDLDLDEENDDLALFSIAFNDICMAAGSTSSQLSNVGWQRLYNNYVKGSGNKLLFKAFWRALKPNLLSIEVDVIEPKGLSLYVDFCLLTDNQKAIDKWRDNLAAIAYIEKTVKEYIRQYKNDAHRAKQDGAIPQGINDAETIQQIATGA